MDIRLQLDKDFEDKLHELNNKYGEYLADLNGISNKYLSHVKFIDNFIDRDIVADSSVDASSNVGRHDMPTLMGELSKPDKKLLSFNKIYYEMKKRVNKEIADRWMESEWIGELYMHDFPSASFLPYCFAYDLKDLAEKGLFFLDNGMFNAEPPQHLETFIDFVKEYISFTCNRSSGAVGMPNLIPYMFYFWKKDVESGHYMRDPEYHRRQQIQRLIYGLNQPYTRDGVQSAFTNTSVFDHPYFEALFGAATFPDGSYMMEYEEEVIEFEKVFLEVFSSVRSKNMMTFPVNTISLLRQNGKFVDEEFARFAVEHNRKWSDSNLFIDNSVNSLSNCCRLKSDIRDLGYFNSIGGSALKVGSCKVSTINLARLALETDTIDEYLKRLEEITYLDCIALDTQRHIIKRNVEKGLLQNFTYGLVDFGHLYSTIGFLGIYETLYKFGFTETDEFGNTYYTKEGEDLGEKIFEVIRNTSAKFIKDNGCDYKINIEQTPGESAADKLMQKDKIFYPDTVVDVLPLYGNQFMPLGVRSTMKERIRVQALFDGFCNGGSILHANIDAPFDSFEKAWDMVNYIADAGVTYFAFNTRIQACKHNHAFYGKVCPVCGSPVETEYTRIVGFLTSIKTWSSSRRDEYKMRRWAPVNSDANADKSDIDEVKELKAV